jgi:multidrug efflux system membrane fusion protein
MGLASVLLAVVGGCEASATKVAPAEPPVVPVSQPIRRTVTDYVEFTGRTEAVFPAEIRPRVTGYLVDMPFREGEEVKAGDLLFVIDRRPYKAQLDQAQGQVDLYKASLKLAKTTLARDTAINASSPGSVSRQQFDQEQAAVDEAEARVKAYEKSMELPRLSHGFTRVLSPIDGQAGRYYLSRGNLVNQDQTLLTTVVSVDPMYAYFEMDEPTLLRIRRDVNAGTMKLADDQIKLPVSMALQGEDGFPHQGTINFVNNKVNPATGTILVRGVFPNSRPPGGRRLLSPGMYVRVRLPIGQPHPALLVVDRAVASDQGQKYVYLLDAENKVQSRRITVGARQDDGLSVIEQGLSGDEWVLVGGLQQVRPRMLARPERLPMPSLAQATGPEREPPRAASKKKAAAPPVVPVSQPVRREVTDYVDFTGRTEAVFSVDIRPRVTGYLVEMPFKEGDEVKERDLLFVVDPRPYKAQLDQAQGQVDLNLASLKLARTTLARDRAISAISPRSVSQQQLDQEEAVVEEAEARVKAFEKSMELYALNYEFTRVISPINGQISRYYWTLGNLVNADQSLLTTVVSVDPMYVYFDMDEPTLLRSRRAINAGKIKLPEDRMKIPVYMGLHGEKGFPHQGSINFVNNQVNPTTGSILVRGVFPNPKPAGGNRLLSPGMFARVRLPIGLPHPALLVIDRAIASDQGVKYVYVVGPDGKVENRRITTGALQDDGLRVVEEGLKGDEWVVVGGLQQVRPLMPATPERIAMPSFVPPGAAGTDRPPSQADPTPPAEPTQGGQPGQPTNSPAAPERPKSASSTPSASSDD